MLSLTGKKKFKIYNGRYGPRICLYSSWSTDIKEEVEKHRVVELELNRAKGWEGTTLSFLKGLPNLLVLDIIDWRIRDISDIHNLHELRVLDVNTYCDNKIDFSCFPKLEDISLEWRAKAKSIFKCSSLKSVFINNYAGRILEPFAKLKQLEHLALKSPRITRIGDIPTLGKLKFLELGNARNLTTLKGIEELANLETLMINTCRKITNIEPVMNLTKLKRLFICNCGDIESLCPISNLKELTEVHFYESTNILDGDLSPLKELPKLKETSFQERRHYNYRISDFGQEYLVGLRKLFK